MLTTNFKLKYLEIALLKFDRIQNEDYDAFFELIKYFWSNPKYNVDFPKEFKFSLKDGSKDESYQRVTEILKDYNFVFENFDFLHFTKEGWKFFYSLEKSCLSIDETFNHYNTTRC